MAHLFKVMGRSVDMASRLLQLLDAEVPNPKVALHYKTPLQLLVATELIGLAFPSMMPKVRHCSLIL